MGSQLRAARGLVNLSVLELAERTGLAINTIRRAEGTNGVAPITAANMSALLDAFDAEGVAFIKADDLGPGVRLKSPEALQMRLRRRSSKSLAETDRAA